MFYVLLTRPLAHLGPSNESKSTTLFLFLLSGKNQTSGAFFGGVFTGLSCCKRGLEQGFKLWVRVIIASLNIGFLTRKYDLAKE